MGEGSSPVQPLGVTDRWRFSMIHLSVIRFSPFPNIYNGAERLADERTEGIPNGRLPEPTIKG